MATHEFRKFLPAKDLSRALLCMLFAAGAAHAAPKGVFANLLSFPNASGYAATFSTAGAVDLGNPFFQSFGTNGRTCASCHRPDDGWTVTPQKLQSRFEATQGTDPIFRLNDGAVSPLSDVSSVEARRSAYRMLLAKGLIRVGISVPANADFELVGVDDPYGYAGVSELSLFRRPLPSTNLRFLSTVMWDGRETFADPASTDCISGTTKCFASIHFDLSDQANGATLGHAQASQGLGDAQREAIVTFESGLYTAQIFDAAAGDLTASHARGGPLDLSEQVSHFGINDVVAGDYQTSAPFDADVFKLYSAWTRTTDGDGRAGARAAVARGEQIFNRHPIAIAGVKGLNDDLGIPTLQGSCSTCHDAPGAGDHSIPAPLDIGLTDAARRTPDLPLYTLRHKSAPFETVQTTDPGRALVSGKWADIGKFKGPVLRALATRAPYFHNGSARDLGAVVDFYNERFTIGLTPDEKDDLVAFLRSL